MNNEIFGYSLFNEQREPLRSFNRCAVIANLMETSNDQAKEYLSQFSELERAKCVMMAMSIQEHGVEAIKKKVVSEYTFEEDA